ncbi:hypothetical protein BaRGS_00002110 [Batillaria attramentaria]|uniref:Fe2OG dioxygenase domain-containing protein n=1 Tax=Batillaria attramentaria TaxID=370345 RepID=A0ABD0M4P3_9CAEN
MAKDDSLRQRKTPHQRDAHGATGAGVKPFKFDQAAMLKKLITISITFAFVRFVLIPFLMGPKDYDRFVGKDAITGKAVYMVPCSKDYESEEFEECKPKECRRVVRDDLVSLSDAQHLLGVAKRGLSLGGSLGGASILDIHSGALSMGEKFVNIYKLLESMEEEIFSAEDFEVYRRVKGQIHNAIAEEFGIPKDKLYLTKPTFFSRMNMTPPKTIHDEYWHPHVDKETYGSFHYTSLLYLTTYQQDFDGGRFVFIDKKSNKTVEPRIGRVSFFTSGSENVHFVERLKDGTRYAITISFSCNPEHAIADPTLK